MARKAEILNFNMSENHFFRIDLVVRLRIELGIGRDEERASLERKLRHIDLVTALAIVPAALGALALLPRLSNLGMSFDLADSGARQPE